MPINSFLYPGAKFIPGYEVANSCRFDRASSASMNRSMSDGSSIKSTFSAWIKVDGTDNEMNIMSHFEDTNNVFSIVTSGSSVYVADYNSGYSLQLATNRVMRDPSAWFHLYVAIDRSQGTASNRNRIFINGIEETSFAHSTNYSQQTSGSHENAISMNDGDCTMYIGQLGNGNQYFGGYLAEVVYLDGTVSDVTNFGEFDDDSPTIWKPINVSGLSSSKGTNGFYLDFEDSSNLGNCAFGGTDFTEANLAATDQSTDTCTNNFCTMNPLNRYQYNFTFEEGNLKVSNSSNNWHAASGTIGINTGKWYFEAKYTGSSNLQHWYVGFGGEAQNASDATRNSVAFYNNDGGEVHTSDVSNNTATTADYGTFSQNDIIGIALDYDNEYISVYKNGSAIVTNYDYGATSYSSNLKDGKTIFPYVAHYASGDISLNFGSPTYSISSGNSDANGYGNFEYSVPSGYYSINTKNLAEFG